MFLYYMLGNCKNTSSRKYERYGIRTIISFVKHDRPGQGSVPHCSDCTIDPSHSFPPNFGVGELQLRVRVFDPPPHDLEHLE